MSDPLPFPASAGVPIVGQPCKLGAWFPTINLICNCEAQSSLLIVGFKHLAICPHCGRGFELHGVQQDIRTGQPPHFDINIVLPSARVPEGKPS